MKATSLWIWGPIMLVMGFVISLIIGAKPVQTDAGKFASQPMAVRNSLEMLAKQATANPNSSSVTVHFAGPHPIKDDQSEFWSFNRRLGVLIGFVNVEKKGKVEFSKIVCPNRKDTDLAELVDKKNLTTDPKSAGCYFEDPRQIGGKEGVKHTAPQDSSGTRQPENKPVASSPQKT
jgi:hypothetical protein